MLVSGDCTSFSFQVVNSAAGSVVCFKVPGADVTIPSIYTCLLLTLPSEPLQVCTSSPDGTKGGFDGYTPLDSDTETQPT